MGIEVAVDVGEASVAAAWVGAGGLGGESVVQAAIVTMRKAPINKILLNRSFLGKWMVSFIYTF